jgi:hypothetical protein
MTESRFDVSVPGVEVSRHSMALGAIALGQAGVPVPPKILTSRLHLTD